MSAAVSSTNVIRLYSGPLSMFGMKAEIALKEKGIAADVVMVPFAMRTLYQPKHPEVLRINPKAQVPVLLHDGLEIFDSTQIFEYLETSPRNRRCGRGNRKRAPARGSWSSSRTRCSSRR